MNQSRQRIVFVATDLSTGGGVNKVIRDLAVLFRQELGAEVTVVSARSDQPSTYAFPTDIPIETHAPGGLLAYFWLLWRLRRSGPDYVIGSWTQDNILIALAFLFSRTKVVLVEHSSWHFHSTPIRLLRWAAYPSAWRVIVLNPTDLRHYQRHFSNVRLIPNPVSPPPGGTEQRERLVLAIGHLEAAKNFEDAIRAMADARLEQEGWSLAILGSGSREPALRSLMAELGLKATTIHERVDDLGNWYDRASLLLLTSRLESFSLVLAEGMLAGVIPIAYPSDGPAFVLEEFPDLLVAMGDVGALSVKMRQLSSAANLEPLRRRLAKSVEGRFSPQAALRLWEQQVFAGGGTSK